jgi:hypothetical protein
VVLLVQPSTVSEPDAKQVSTPLAGHLLCRQKIKVQSTHTGDVACHFDEYFELTGHIANWL